MPSLQPFDQRVLRVLSGGGVRVVDDEYHYPLFPAACFHVTRDGFNAFQCAGLEVGGSRDLAILETFFYRAIHAEYRQRRFQFGGKLQADTVYRVNLNPLPCAPADTGPELRVLRGARDLRRQFAGILFPE